MNVNIFRIKKSDHGTEGVLSFQDFTCYTLELPWRDNLPNISCIPSGKYKTRIRISPRFGKVYHVIDVPDRTYVLIHSGNFAGNKDKGLKTHVQGCLLLGKHRGLLQGQQAVLCSRPTVRRFIEKLKEKPFTLSIYEAF